MNWKMIVLNVLRKHGWQLTPEQQFLLAVAYMHKVASAQNA